MTEPQNLATTGDRTTGGQFAKGHKGYGGRPRKLDFFKAAETWAKSENKTPEDALAEVVGAAITAAIGGDMVAAKIIIDRFCGKELDKVELTDDRNDMPDEEFARRVVSLLAILQARKAATQN